MNIFMSLFILFFVIFFYPSFVFFFEYQSNESKIILRVNRYFYPLEFNDSIYIDTTLTANLQTKETRSNSSDETGRKNIISQMTNLHM